MASGRLAPTSRSHSTSPAAPSAGELVSVVSSTVKPRAVNRSLSASGSPSMPGSELPQPRHQHLHGQRRPAAAPAPLVEIESRCMLACPCVRRGRRLSHVSAWRPDMSGRRGCFAGPGALVVLLAERRRHRQRKGLSSAPQRTLRGCLRWQHASWAHWYRRTERRPPPCGCMGFRWAEGFASAASLPGPGRDAAHHGACVCSVPARRSTAAARRGEQLAVRSRSGRGASL